MGIITKEVETRIGGRQVEYYKSLGYEIPMRKASKSHFLRTGKEFCYDLGKSIFVKPEHLPKRSNAMVDVLCDMCKKNIMHITYNLYNRRMEATGSYVCKECAPEKARMTIRKLYGVDNVFQSDVIKEQIRQTLLSKYNVEHPLQAQEIKERMIETNIERYGVKNVALVPEIQQKMAETNLERYGGIAPAHSESVRKKMNETFYKNGTQKVSKQQRYLNRLYGGILNYPIKYYSADICLPDEMLCIEYDGGGHLLNVISGRLTQEEHDQKEIIRNNTVKREGYKQMRIISRKDLLPSDQTLLDMLSQARDYFSNTSHTWINYDIDNNIMINAENKDTGGTTFDYGVLRKIKEVQETKEEIKESA